MVKAVNNGAAAATQAAPPYVSRGTMAELDASQVTELVSAAAALLRRDLEMCHPNKPAIAYALAGETHAAMLLKWRQHPPAVQATLLTALMEEATGLLRQLQARIARIVPAHGYMFGMQDEAMKLETQVEIAMEEIRRIDADLRGLKTQEVLQ